MGRGGLIILSLGMRCHPVSLNGMFTIAVNLIWWWGSGEVGHFKVSRIFQSLF